jgi:copper chaperone CopZ
MQTTLSISGMSCGHCVQAVREALASVPGVTVEQVRIGAATLSYDPAAVAIDDVVRAIEDAGYAPEVSSR